MLQITNAKFLQHKHVLNCINMSCFAWHELVIWNSIKAIVFKQKENYLSPIITFYYYYY